MAKWLLYLSLFSIAIGQFGRIPPGSGGTILVLDILVALFFSYWLLWLAFHRFRLQMTPLHLAWAGFLGIGLILLILPPFPISRSDLIRDSFYWLRLLFYSSLIWSIPAFFSTESKAKQLLNLLIRIGLAVTLLGFVQLYLLPNLGSLAKYGWDPHVGRVVSTFLDPNFLGGYLALMLSLILARYMVEKKYFPWWQTLLILLAGVLTFSRSGYLAIALVVLLYGLRYSWKLMILAILILTPLALSIPRIGDRVRGGIAIDQTAQDRIDSWELALTTSAAYPLGVGYNNYQLAQEHLGQIIPGGTSKASGGSDSSLLNVLVTTGWLGFALFLTAILLLLQKSWQSWKSGTPVQKTVGLGLIMAAPSLFLHAWFVNAYFYPFILLTLTTLVGLLYSRPGQSATLEP